MLLIENVLLQVLLQFEQFSYFLDHASSDTEVLIGTINFILIFIVLPTAILAIPVFILIKTGIKFHKQYLINENVQTEHFSKTDRNKAVRWLYMLLLFVGLLVLATALISFTPVKTSDRQEFFMLSKPLKSKVNVEASGMNVDQIIDYSLDLTASQLRFSLQNDIINGKANCVGYAQLCASICNEAFEINGIRALAKPVVGYIESCGINWCDVLKAIAPQTSYKNFVKDHDFVELTIDSRTYYFDPTIYDVLGKKCLTITN